MISVLSSFSVSDEIIDNVYAGEREISLEFTDSVASVGPSSKSDVLPSIVETDSFDGDEDLPNDNEDEESSNDIANEGDEEICPTLELVDAEVVSIEVGHALS